MGLLILWGQNYGIQYLVKKRTGLENWPRFRGWCLPLCMNFPSSKVAKHNPHPAKTCFHYDPVKKKMGVLPFPPPPWVWVFITISFYCCSYAMKHDGRRANHITVVITWHNRTFVKKPGPFVEGGGGGGAGGGADARGGGCKRNPLSGQIISKSCSFHKKLSLHP